jgi:predicted metal-dependent HD superfamily phosphohydrolase
MKDRWLQTWRRLGATPKDTSFERLVAAYSEPHRHYHTVRHLHDTFALLDEIARFEPVSVEVELALWFHDVVYDPRAKDNEALSALWAAQELATIPDAVSVSEHMVRRVESLVLATKHSKALPADHQMALLLDVDLSILGAPFERFREYETEVRREYAWVPALAYRVGRTRVLEGFLQRPALFNTSFCQQRFESQARSNLAWAKTELAPPLLLALVDKVRRVLSQRR